MLCLTLLSMCDHPRDCHSTTRTNHRHRLPERGWIQFLLLTLLNDTPMHGYQLIEEMENKGYVRKGRFKTGSVYTILNRMEHRGFLLSIREESKSGRPRRTYSITDTGRQYLKRELEQLMALKKTLDELEKYYNSHFGEEQT